MMNYGSNMYCPKMSKNRFLKDCIFDHMLATYRNH